MKVNLCNYFQGINNVATYLSSCPGAGGGGGGGGNGGGGGASGASLAFFRRSSNFLASSKTIESELIDLDEKLVQVFHANL